MVSNTVTRLVVRFTPQNVPIGDTAGKNFFAFDQTTTLGERDSFGYPGGSGYVWHCHILDHEDNMMMCPFEVRKYAQIPSRTTTPNILGTIDRSVSSSKTVSSCCCNNK